MRKALLVLLCLVTSVLSAQKLTYDVYLFGDKIGSAIIQRKATSDSTVEYLLQSSTVATVLFTTRRSYQNYLVHYKNNKLVKVAATNNVNDEVTEVNIDWDINRYVVKRNKKYSYLNSPIAFSTLCIYFKKPVPGVKIFSERLAEDFTVKPNSDGTLEYTLSDGIRNIFRYKDDTPTLILMKKSFVTVEMRLVKVDNQQD